MTSLAAFAAGYCAWRAVRHGGTWAGDRVLFEPVQTFDVGAEPLVVIYSEAGKIDARQGPLLGGAGLRMRFETWLGGAEPEGLDPGLSSALPFTLFWRQCARALFAGEPGSWGDLFRVFAGPVTSSETLFDLYESTKGERIAVRGQALVFGQSLGEPAFGAAPQGKWIDLLARMRAEGVEHARYADVIAAAIEGAPVVDWRADLAALGVPTSDAAGLRLEAPAFASLPDAGAHDVEIAVASDDGPALSP